MQNRAGTSLSLSQEPVLRIVASVIAFSGGPWLAFHWQVWLKNHKNIDMEIYNVFTVYYNVILN